MSEPTVFIIDDDEACCDSIREVVLSVGLTARVFNSAFQFLDALDPTWRGCLILDLHMPGMDGLSLQKRLQEKRASLPIVFVSGSVDIPTAFRAIKFGAVDFLQKPYTQELLLEAIERALKANAA